MARVTTGLSFAVRFCTIQQPVLRDNADMNAIDERKVTQKQRREAEKQRELERKNQRRNKRREW